MSVRAEHHRDDTLLQALAYLYRQVGSFRDKQPEATRSFLASLGLSEPNTAHVLELLHKLDNLQLARMHDFHWHLPAECTISWGPSVLAPVFYGMQELDTTAGAPCALRVFYPSTEGAVEDAPFLGCGHYPLIIFLHGHCSSQGAEQYRKWYLLPAQLARCGYVVVVPQLLDISSGSGPWQSTDLQVALDVVDWMQSQWGYHHFLLTRPPITGVAGHSYGALLGARLAIQINAQAYASLSGVWLDWPSDPPCPLNLLNMPSLFFWGSSTHFNEVDAVLEDAATNLWNEVPAPKHKVVFEDGDHWDYLPDSQINCGQLPGNCNLVKSLAADFTTMFFSKYIWPEESGILPGLIEGDLMPLNVHRSPEQEFFAGGHLMGMSLVSTNPSCNVKHSWVNDAGVSDSATL